MDIRNALRALGAAATLASATAAPAQSQPSPAAPQPSASAAATTQAITPIHARAAIHHLQGLAAEAGIVDISEALILPTFEMRSAKAYALIAQAKGKEAAQAASMDPAWKQVLSLKSLSPGFGAQFGNPANPTVVISSITSTREFLERTDKSDPMLMAFFTYAHELGHALASQDIPDYQHMISHIRETGADLFTLQVTQSMMGEDAANQLGKRMFHFRFTIDHGNRVGYSHANRSANVKTLKDFAHKTAPDTPLTVENMRNMSKQAHTFAAQQFPHEPTVTGSPIDHEVEHAFNELIMLGNIPDWAFDILRERWSQDIEHLRAVQRLNRHIRSLKNEVENFKLPPQTSPER